MPEAQSRPETVKNLPALMPADLADKIVQESIHKYFDQRRARIPEFIDRHFSVKGAWDLNKRAFGRDLYRTPANVLTIAPVLLARTLGRGLKKRGKPWLNDKIESRDLHLKTDVNRELEWRLYTDLLEVPFSQPGRQSERDALAEEIFNNRTLSTALEQAINSVVDAAGPRNKQQLQSVMSQYLETRAANAEVVNLALSLAIGATIAHKVTPGALTLGPTMANAIAQKAAVGTFPLGASMGTMWYSAFPIAPSAALAATTTGGALALAAVVTAFSGVAADPLQRSLGLHQRRLDKFVDTLEDNMLYDEVVHLRVKDHYVGRLIDLFDALGAMAAYAK